MANPPVPRHDTLPEDASVAKWMTDSERFLKAIDGDITTVTRVIVTGATPISLTIINNIRDDLEAGGRAPLSVGGLSGLPLNVSNLIGDAKGFSTTIIFSALDNNTVQWTAGTITFGGGEVFTVVAGNTGNMTLTTYIYFDSSVSTSTLQISTNPDDASGPNKQYLASADPIADTNQNAAWVPVIGVLGINETIIGPKSVSTPLLQADAVTANEILANTITGNEIFGTTLSTIFANLGEVTAGTITGLLYRTTSSGRRVELQSGAFVGSVRFFNAVGTHVASVEELGSSLAVVALAAGGGIVISTASVASIQMLVNSIASVTLSVGGGVDIHDDIDMNTNDILNAGNVELDSITKDGAGNVLFNDIIDMGGRSIINIGNVECDSLTKDGSGAIKIFDDLHPSSNSAWDLGSSGLRFERIWSVNLNVSSGATLPAGTQIGSILYAWPSSQSSGQQLQTNGSGTLTWAAAGSLRAYKRILRNKVTPSQALKKILKAPIEPFRYKKGFGTGTKDLYLGPMAEDFPEVMHHKGTIFSPVSGFGYLALSIKELNLRIAKLEG